MGLRFHQSFSIIPGLRINVSKSGLSASIGSAPFTMNIGPHGVTETVSLPGTGLSYRHHEGGHAEERPQQPVSQRQPFHPPPISTMPTTPSVPVHSASAEVLTSASLEEVKKLITRADQQYSAACSALDTANTEKAKSTHRFDSWDTGWLFKRLFKKAFEKRREAMDEATQAAAKLEQQRTESQIDLDIDLEEGPHNAYYLMVEAFERVCQCTRIWDIQSHRSVDKYRERSTANDSIERTTTTFNRDGCNLLKSDLRVPHLKNAKGGSLYLFPGFILYRASQEAFSLIEYREVTPRVQGFSFQEAETVPGDSTVEGRTWRYCNKDGSRDRRFAENYEIPVVKYGGLYFATAAGLREEFLLSQYGPVEEFVQRMVGFTSSFSGTDS
jgi:hypothetical protein